ncbi:hypothetical protein L3H40_10750 [Corynebacterium sp. MC-15]|nr:hypothetical protein [Corynebacterium parakroppenstedtii]MCG2675547.1 hypothetical protein [Corynebacterium parakroppenstedtii]
MTPLPMRAGARQADAREDWRCRAGEAAWRWPGPPGRCARMGLPMSAVYASRRVLVLGHDIALGMSLGITLIPNANAIGAKSYNVIPC